ncbi:MAG: flippase-like domain-containing protein [Oscillospiraceae bacterium]|jgi:uncharacterized protein (TIRG00374 family)|nr:flippase-like domain-containing protein [Oscillospiraceae bacterium]
MSDKKPSKKMQYLFTVIVLAVTMIIVLACLLREKSLPELGRIFTSLDPFWMLLALGTLFGAWGLEGLCNWLLSRHLYPEWTYGRSFMVGITGIFYACITPCGAAGQPMQIYYMSKMGMEPGPSAAIISAKTLTHQCTMVVFSLFLILTELPFFVKNVSNLTLFTIFGLVTNVIFILAVILISVNAKLIHALLRGVLAVLGKMHIVKDIPSSYDSIVRHLNSFQRGFKTMGKSWKLYLLVCAITVVQLILGSYDTYCIYRAFHLYGASMWQVIAAEVFAGMVVSFIPLPGNSGGAEASFEAFCHIFFGNMTTPAMLVWRLISYYGSIIFGGILVFIGSRRYLDKTTGTADVIPPAEEIPTEPSAPPPTAPARIKMKHK